MRKRDTDTAGLSIFEDGPRQSALTAPTVQANGSRG